MLQSVSLRTLMQGRPVGIGRGVTAFILIWLNKESAITFQCGTYFKNDCIYLSDYCEDPRNPTQTELSLIELTLGIIIDLKG